MDIVIFGTGGFGREVHQLLEDIINERCLVNESGVEQWNFKGFIDDNTAIHGQLVHNYPVLGSCECLADSVNVGIVVAVGNPASKRKIVDRIKNQLPSVEFPTLIHPSVIVGERVKIGQGTIICAGTIITTDLEIGEHVIVNLDCTVAHDDVIGDFVTIAPSVNVSGNVKVGEGTDLGTSSTIINGINIGEWSVIGAGTVVIRDISDNVTAVGNPAKVIKERTPGWQYQK